MYKNDYCRFVNKKENYKQLAKFISSILAYWTSFKTDITHMYELSPREGLCSENIIS